MLAYTEVKVSKAVLLQSELRIAASLKVQEVEDKGVLREPFFPSSSAITTTRLDEEL